MIESAARVERISTDSAPRSGYHWEVPQKPVAVNLPFEMIDRLDRLVVESFRSLTSRGSEIGGILVGRAAQGSPLVVAIDDFELISCDYSRGPLYRLSDADMARFERAIEQHANNAARVVGYFRSHTRKGLALDPEDVSFLDSHFRDAHHIALLVRPYASKASTAGIFIRENGVYHPDASYLEFPFRAAELTASAPAPSASGPSPAEEPPAAPAAPQSASSASSKPATRGQIVPIASRRETSSSPEASALAAPADPAPAVIEPPVRKPVPEPAPKTEDKSPRKEEKSAPKEDKNVRKDEKTARKEEKSDKPAPKVEAKAEVKTPESKPETKTAAKPEPAKAAVKDAVKDVVKESAKKAQPEAAADAPKRGKGLLIAVVGLLLAGGGAGAYFMFGGHKAGRIPTGSSDAAQLNLRVEHSGADLLLTWNRDAAAIKGAAHAVLSISDGERQENYDMDPGQLANGSIVYSPLTPDVSFRMEVTGTDHSKVGSESVRVLRTRPSPMPDDPKNGKPGTPATAANTPATKNDSTASTSTPTPAADEAPVEREKLSSPTRPFDSASLSQPLTQRLRQATSSDLPDAPTVGGSSAPQAMSAPNFGSMAPAPTAPRGPAPAPPQTPQSSTPKAGGQITQAQLLVRKDPEYPKIAQQMGVRGTVELLATIGTDGKVKSVKVISGHNLLTKPAQDAVMQWVYKPTLLNGIPVENETHIKIDFASGK